VSRMEHTRQVLSAILILSVLHCTVSTYFGDVFAQQADEPSKIGWLFSDSSIRTKRIQRAISERKRESEDDGSPKIINGQCRDKLNRLCGDIDGNNDELMLLECIQTFKVCILLLRIAEASIRDLIIVIINFAAYRDIWDQSEVSGGNLVLHPEHYR
jgi:hypothetical protein